ncbi:MAG: hypothetical protein ACLQVJ_08005 [Syntrophobacteraceae bacterium]
MAVINEANVLGREANEKAEKIGEIVFRQCFTFPESELDPPKKRAALKIVCDREDDLGVKKSTLFNWIAVARQKRWCKARGVDVSVLSVAQQTELTRMREDAPGKLVVIKEALAFPNDFPYRALAALVKRRKAPAKPRRKPKNQADTQASQSSGTPASTETPTGTGSTTLAEVKQLETLLTILTRWDWQGLELAQGISAKKEFSANVKSILPLIRSLLAKFERVSQEIENSRRLENDNQENEGADLETAAVRL